MSYNTLSPTNVASKEFIGKYAQSYIDLYSLANSTAVPNFKEQVYSKFFQKGELFKMLDFLRMAGNEFSVHGRRLTAFEEAVPRTSCTLNTALTAAGSTGYGAGDTIYFKLASTDYDANGNGPLRKGFTVSIPGKYFGKSRPVSYYISLLSTTGTVGGLSAGTGADTVYTAKPLDSTADISTDVPQGTKLMIGFSAYGTGAGQPSPMVNGTLQRDFYTHIIKETGTIEGGANAHERYEMIDMPGGPRLFDKMSAEREFALDRQQETAMLFSELNAATITDTNTASGAATTLRTTKGLFPIMDDLAQKMVLDTTWSAIEDWDAIKSLQLSQGVSAPTSIIFAGNGLYTQMENTLMEEMLYRSDAIYDEQLNMFGVNFKKVLKGGHLYYIIELPTLSNPNSYGISDYKLTNQGFVIPMGNVKTTIQGDGVTYGGSTYTSTSSGVFLPNAGVGYLNGNGEDRRTIIAPVAGPNGMGYSASNQYDEVSLYYVREFMFFLMKANELIWIH